MLVVKVQMQESAEGSAKEVNARYVIRDAGTKKATSSRRSSCW